MPAASSATAPQPSLFLESIIIFLLPCFITATTEAAARSEIIETLAAYATRTRAELLHAARIIAFGMSTLDTLAEAQAEDLSTSMRIRYRSCANGLNRSCKQHEDALTRRLSRDLPATTETHPEPVNDLPEADAQRAIKAAQTEIANHRKHLPAVRPATAPPANRGPRQPERNAHPGALVQALRQMGASLGPAPGG
jgi:hypothetical protein